MTEVKATFMEYKGKPRIIAKWDYTPDFQRVIDTLAPLIEQQGQRPITYLPSGLAPVVAKALSGR